MNVAICGGGTGGHLHPLLALAEELASHDGVETALYLSRKSPSSALLAGKKVIALEVSGFVRRADAANIRAIRDLLAAFKACRREMRKDTPAVAAAFGGYASVPGALAALSLRVPLVIHEQNVIPGLANRLLAPAASALAVSFDQTLARCPRWGRKAVVTGNPLLRRPRQGTLREARESFGLSEGRKTLAVVGGSQGAASLNRAVLEALPAWSGRSDLQLVHAVGRDKFDEFMTQAEKMERGELVYRPMRFIERMDLVYGVADLVVCRAGASTIAELAAAACPSILVPYPYATAAHQDANAAVLCEEGAALLLEDRQLSGSRLAREVDSLLADAGRLEAMREAARRVGRPDAAAALAGLVLSMA
ncbi:MAG: undecaprenyldiphospho-muramoylpentapeptide beta-N-acetylglucosaminyltransferase [Actinomycetota bacterium]|nr:undecaprenyldiphospho-muramoylpentapeptide beta-N-acetylglucosaminyltransferase [Actinomycetota bacterium]MDD5666872.1 undecaprenyldiphospho-muramoylpentapeptide beta-N-acetylglucosaminyltransferase [Actinomycetota bacterium]